MSGFASANDLADKTVSFDELGPGLFAYTAEGDPNSGVIVGPDGVVVVDAQATPAMAQDVMARIATVTPRHVGQVVLTHYHAVRVLGASGYGNPVIIASETTRDLIVERGQQDMDSEIGRFPRLFRGKESIPGLTWPTHSFDRRMSIWLGKREAQVIHVGRSHTAGDTVVWMPEDKVLFAGDTVEFGATPYCGDAHFADWSRTLDAVAELGAERMVPGRGRALMTKGDVREAIEGTRSFTTDLFTRVKEGVAKGWGLKEIYDDTMGFMRPKYGSWVIFEHCMPFNVTRAFDEAKGLDHPRIWTAERDVEMWRALEHGTAMKSAEVHG
ncbi:MBL fold metallo-hydrolase [Roseomonas stagni]|uniref:MBL fold metallo-hydrolase n=1 Tax=Falsiroseomonas algicola TaxID=2716930 RepID=A0A6M1LM56_9PROT|nr:MBL fold metallo-hydrolase [Falsiroseomonas algicola]NGM21152.1 MBL fold metallo-hydrolase [Falsiroseomonas algicola]